MYFVCVATGVVNIIIYYNTLYRESFLKLLLLSLIKHVFFPLRTIQKNLKIQHSFINIEHIEMESCVVK